jgi:hypothetical protein
MYRCSIYTKTAGKKCNHNNIAAEALLQFTAKTLVTLMQRAAGNDQLRTAVSARIREMQKAPPSPDEAIRAELIARVERLRQTVAQAPKRILEDDRDDVRALLRAGLSELQAELGTAEKAVGATRDVRSLTRQHLRETPEKSTGLCPYPFPFQIWFDGDAVRARSASRRKRGGS